MKNCDMARAEFYDTSFTNCSFEKVNLGASDFDTCKFEMTTFSQSNLDSISLESVKIKSEECKRWLEIKNFSNFENYFGRSDNGN
jgi:uncharacterized protein YjbI with pentapeptide repeats